MSRTIRNGLICRLAREIWLKPIFLNGEPIRMCDPYHYRFLKGTRVEVNQYQLDVRPDGTILDSVDFIRVETLEKCPRIIHVLREELKHL